MIVNSVNHKFYVGSSKSIKNRLRGHIKDLNNGTHANIKLQHAWNKYGEENFFYLVVEECECELILTREQYWLDTTKASQRHIGYNLVADAGGGWSKGAAEAGTKAAALVTKGKPRSQQVKDAIGKAHKGRIKSPIELENIRNSHWSKGPNAAEIIERSAAKHRGIKHSEEHKAKIGVSHWKNRPDADLVREKLKKSLLGQKRTAKQRENIRLAAFNRSS